MNSEKQTEEVAANSRNCTDVKSPYEVMAAHSCYSASYYQNLEYF